MLRPMLLLTCSMLFLSRDDQQQAVEPAEKAAGRSAVPPSPILVELFTSEGCSDCPPADALLRQFYNTRTPQGRPILVLSEHVTYWDRLGWKDSFSDETFTYRQNGCAARFHLDSKYTPQMVVNGAQQFVGNNARLLRDALSSEVPRSAVDLKILSIERGPDDLRIHVSAANLRSTEPLDLMAAIIDDHDESHVERGENGGRTLVHVAVARTLTRVAHLRGDSDQMVHLPLPSALRQSSGVPRHLTLFAQQRDFGQVVGAVTQALPAQGHF